MQNYKIEANRVKYTRTSYKKTLQLLIAPVLSLFLFACGPSPYGGYDSVRNYVPDKDFTPSKWGKKWLNTPDNAYGGLTPLEQYKQEIQWQKQGKYNHLDNWSYKMYGKSDDEIYGEYLKYVGSSPDWKKRWQARKNEYYRNAQSSSSDLDFDFSDY